MIIFDHKILQPWLNTLSFGEYWIFLAFNSNLAVNYNYNYKYLKVETPITITITITQKSVMISN